MKIKLIITFLAIVYGINAQYYTDKVKFNINRNYGGKIKKELIGVYFQAKKDPNYERIRTRFKEKLKAKIINKFGEEGYSRVFLVSDELTKLGKVNKKKKILFRSYIPKELNVKDSKGNTPSIIIFIKRFGTKNKTVQEAVTHGQSNTFGHHMSGTYKQRDAVQFSFVYFFYDNANGEIIGYSEQSRLIKEGKRGLSYKAIEKMVEGLSNNIIKNIVNLENFLKK